MLSVLQTQKCYTVHICSTFYIAKSSKGKWALCIACQYQRTLSRKSGMVFKVVCERTVTCIPLILAQQMLGLMWPENATVNGNESQIKTDWRFYAVILNIAIELYCPLLTIYVFQPLCKIKKLGLPCKQKFQPE